MDKELIQLLHFKKQYGRFHLLEYEHFTERNKSLVSAKTRIPYFSNEFSVIQIILENMSKTIMLIL